MFVQIIKSLFKVRYQCFLRGRRIQLIFHFPLKPLLRSRCCYFSNFISEAKKCWSWHCALLACHHQVCAVNTAGQNLQSSLEDQQQQLVHGHDWDLASCLSHSIACTVSCYFRGIYVTGFGLVSTSNWRSDAVHQNTLTEFTNSIILILTRIPTRYRAGAAIRAGSCLAGIRCITISPAIRVWEETR